MIRDQEGVMRGDKARIAGKSWHIHVPNNAIDSRLRPHRRAIGVERLFEKELHLVQSDSGILSIAVATARFCDMTRRSKVTCVNL